MLAAMPGPHRPQRLAWVHKLGHDEVVYLGFQPRRLVVMQLNERAARLCDALASAAESLRVAVHRCPSGARVVDCGIDAPGGLEAGLHLARVALAGLASVELVPDRHLPLPRVVVRTDHPAAACMGSQYAGWAIRVGDYFAMASGPMRAAAAREPLFQKLDLAERPSQAVGVLETCRLPSPEVCQYVASQCSVPAHGLILLAARTSSLAGMVQVVARSLETALHKLLELGFDLKQVEAGFGAAPLPPAAKSDREAMGRTNDAVLYGSEVVLWVRGDDSAIAQVGPRLPSEASPDYGTPFLELLQRCGGDFYALDPLLFGPAAVTMCNVDTGQAFRFGRVAAERLASLLGLP